MVVVGVVALIVVGPKDLPMMFRKVGNFVGKARGMARDFQNAMHDAADESGVNELKKSIQDVSNVKDMQLDDLGLDDIAPGATDFSAKIETGTPKAETSAPAAKASAVKKPADKAAPKKPAAKKAPAKKPAAQKTAKRPAAKKAP
ncbi:hypothetical protein GCM10007939_10300 [Amylibacter marinus]|uniref:Sec-independent protein translocase protein TatB n=2 Tax=Amylibacter marinus TaxID=1475483 RepID=A0ABQ5VU21_9RHOB|nr:hypothetical protein GCM10007939_10300 [Amylibacter marinus]